MTTQQYKRPATSAPVAGEAGLPNRDKFQSVSATRPRIPISSEDIDSEINNLVDAVNELYDTAISGTVPDNSVTLAKLTHQGEGELYSFDATTAPVVVAKGSAGQVLTANASGAPSFQNAAASPSGAVVAFAGSSAPSGWLLCDGSAVNRTTYSDLFAVVSTTYGSGDGSTTFNVPDLRGRKPLGLDDMGGTSADRVVAAAADTLGGTGGAEGATSSTEGHALTASEMTHKHETTVVSPAKISTTAAFGTGSTSLTTSLEGGAGSSSGNGHLTNTPESVTSSAHDHDLAQENILDPYIAMNYIIKT